MTTYHVRIDLEADADSPLAAVAAVRRELREALPMLYTVRAPREGVYVSLDLKSPSMQAALENLEKELTRDNAGDTVGI